MITKAYIRLNPVYALILLSINELINNLNNDTKLIIRKFVKIKSIKHVWIIFKKER